jgi:hypothetical protein
MRHLKVQLKAGRSTRANWPCPSQETASAVTANNIFICPKDPTWFLLTIQLQPVHADPSIHPLFKTRLTVFQSPGSQGSESQAVGTLRSARFNCFPAEADSISTDQRSHESVILQRKTFQHSNSQLAIRPAVEVIATQSAINADQDCIYLTIALRNPLPCSLQVRSVSLEQSLQYSSTLLPHESAEFTMEPDAVQSLLLRIRFPQVAYHIGEVKGRSDGDSVPNLDLMGVHTTSRLIVCCLPADISSGPLTASVAAAVEMRFPLDIILQSHSHIAPNSLPTTTTATKTAAAADNCNNGLLISFKPVSQCVPVSRVFTVNASLNNRSNRRRILCISIPTYLPSSSSFNHKRQSIDTYLGEYYRQQSTMSHTAGDSVVKQSQFICLDNDTVVDLGPGEATVLSLHFIPIGGEGSLQSLDLVRLVDITDDNNCTAGSLSSQQVTQLRQVFQVFVIN